ncbi:MAG TPA: glycosyltransferase family A protein, partial [Chitinophagaceae bacterium]|nr:glycosyltransferase family A protein [Chitinophagaceae bacterium]
MQETAVPLVSVLMTAYNRENYIGDAIESALASTYKNLELLIVDDGSKDNTVSIAMNYAAKDPMVKVYVNEKNLGDYLNRNKAASYASGKYLKYLDSDDIMYPHCLEVMVSAMEKFPEAGLGLSAVSDPYKPYPVMLTPKEAYLEYFNGSSHFDRAPGSSIIKKEAFEKVGGFSGERMIGDYDLWLRLAREFPLVKLVPDLYWSRMHEGQEFQSSYAQEQYAALRKMV